MQGTEGARVSRDGQTIFLGWDEEVALAAAWRERRDPAAIDRLVRSHTPLIRSIAAMHPAADADAALRADLEQAASLAFIEVVERWQPDLGFRLNTFARRHMEFAANDAACAEHGATRVATNLTDKRIRLQWRRHGKAADPAGMRRCIEATARALGLPEDRVRVTVERLSAHDFSIDQVMRLDGDPTDAERVAGAARWKLLAEAFAALSAPARDEEEARIDRARIRPYLATAVAGLPDRERAVIVLHYFTEGDASLRWVGATLGRTKSWVQRVEQRALRLLRASVARLLDGHAARNRPRSAAHLKAEPLAAPRLRIRVPAHGGRRTPVVAQAVHRPAAMAR